MRRDDALRIALVRAVEEALPERIPPERLLEAHAAAGEPAQGEAWIARRAAYLVDHALAGYRDVLDRAELHLSGAWPFVLAAVAYYFVNRGTVAIVVALAQGTAVLQSWRHNFGSLYDLLSTGAAFSLGALLATQYAVIGMVGTLFVVLPLVLACDGYRRFTRDRTAPAAESETERKAA